MIARPDIVAQNKIKMYFYSKSDRTKPIKPKHFSFFHFMLLKIKKASLNKDLKDTVKFN